MMTNTHVLVAAAVLARPNAAVNNRAVLAGALAPDIIIYGLFVWALVTGTPQSTLWQEIYWREPIQDVLAIGNAFPHYIFGLLVARFMVLMKYQVHAATLLGLFCGAAVLHLFLDLPVHSDDAHRHFWPFSDYRFVSPFSYWDQDHHAAWVSWIEGAIGLSCIGVLWWRFEAVWVRILLGGFALPYLLVAGLSAAGLLF